ncbi:hypothetical protein R9C00_13870 [Flammeovirgaceae bacterium SG7u.111]|nr:hypothetical protein [Flammeovirgaceae bacterium SG7u.132]WPO38543.1 hypothetical protein R9C00_13870 [Flammeovirgaceae bacterium SG7u.111]
MIKKTLTALALSFLLFSCSQIDELTQFNLDYDASVVISSSTVLDLPFTVITPEIESNSESEFAVNNTKKDLIEEIVLTKLTLTITSPTDGNFDFLESTSIYISADGLDDVEIASKTNIGNGVGNFLELETSGVNLKEYVIKDNFTLKLKNVTDELITSDHHIDIHSEFFVDAKILGQ